MHARSNTARWNKDQLEHAMQLTRDVIIPAYREAKGFRGYVLLTKPEDDTAVALTLWDTEEDMRASEEIARAMVPQLRGVLAGPPQTDRYEVTFYETR